MEDSYEKDSGSTSSQRETGRGGLSVGGGTSIRPRLVSNSKYLSTR